MVTKASQLSAAADGGGSAIAVPSLDISSAPKARATLPGSELLYADIHLGFAGAVDRLGATFSLVFLCVLVYVTGFGDGC